MLSPNVFSRTAPNIRSAKRAVTSVLALGLMCLAACGSDEKKTTATGGTTGTTSVVTTADPTVANSDKTGAEPTTTPTSPAVKTTLNGTDTAMPYVMFSNNANTATIAAKSFAVTAYSYDTCVFSWNHGYKAFPQGKFDFVGFYLVNGTAGAPLATGVYTAGATTGMHIDTQYSGAGYSVTACKAANYPTVASGTVTITALGTGSAGTTGTLNVTMSDGSVFTGDFGTGTCSGGTSSTMPTPASPDTFACSSIN